MLKRPVLVVASLVAMLVCEQVGVSEAPFRCGHATLCFVLRGLKARTVTMVAAKLFGAGLGLPDYLAPHAVFAASRETAHQTRAPVDAVKIKHSATRSTT